MPNKKVVVFAAYFPLVFRAGVYLDALKHYYPDCDFYIGLNSSFPGAEQFLNREGFTNIAHTPKHLEVNSDASAFQSALRLLKSSDKEYEVVHFLHTKGISRQDPKEWQINFRDYFLGYCKNKLIVEERLLKDDALGGIGLVGRVEKDMPGYGQELMKHIDIPSFSKVEDIMSLITFYGVKGSIVDFFIKNCKKEFWDTRLDRYWFEATFPTIVDLCGYKRHHLNMW